MNIDERVRQHLQESTAGVSALNRLEEVMAEGRRRQVRRGTFTVLGAAAMVAAVVSLVPLLLPASDGGQVPGPAATATSPQTSGPPPTTTLPAPEVSTAAPLGVLTAGPNGVAVLDLEGSTAFELDLQGGVEFAYPDQTGGLVYQTSSGILRLAPGEPAPTELAGADAVAVGPGRSPAGNPIFYYLEDSMVKAVDLATGDTTEVTAFSGSEDVTAGGSLLAVVDRSENECPTVRLVDLGQGELPSPLPDCLPLAAGVSVAADGRHLGFLVGADLQVLTVPGGEVVLERSVPDAYMATAGPGGWVIRTPAETVLLSPGGETWTLPAVEQNGWAIPYATPFQLDPAPRPDTTVPETTVRPSVPTAMTCGEVEAELPDQDLPEAVATTRQQLWEMATACNMEGLAALARSDDTILSFGDGDDPIALWEAEAEQGRDPLALLARLLGTTPAEDPDAGLWAWPAVQVDPSNEASWAEVEPIVGSDLVRQMRESGLGYTGYRVGIAADGTWQYFVAGD